MKMNISTKIVSILQKELSYADFAISTLKQEMEVFENEYDMNSRTFMAKFEKGELGDERKWFVWYGLALNSKDWDDTKKEIEKVLRTS